MSTDSSDYRVIEWWPNKDQRCIISMPRTPENEAMSDEELIASFNVWESSERHLHAVDDA